MANSFGSFVDVIHYRTPNGDMPTDVHVGGSFITQVGILPVPGTVYQYERRTANPNVEFRTLGVGKDYNPGTSTEITHALKFLDSSVFTDAARIRNLPPEQVIADDINASVRQSLYQIDQAIFAESQVSGYFEPLASLLADEMILDAGGSGEVLTSVYLARIGDDGVLPLAGNGGVIPIKESVPHTMTGTNGKQVGGYLTLIDGYIGVACRSAYAACRIANISAAMPLTDDVLFEAWSRFPASFKPTHLVANSWALEQLRKSRTATNEKGQPAPLAETVINGMVKVVTCDAISNEEQQVVEDEGGTE